MTTVAAVVAELEDLADPGFRADLVPRYGIHSEPALGVRMADMKRLGTRIGVDHDLALALWATGIYEARTVAGLVADPARLTAERMDAWARDFDSWAIVDSICFNLFDRTGPLAWEAVERWAAATGEDEEMVRRAAFSLLWGLARHDRSVDDEAFLPALALIERTAGDGRHLVATEARAVADRLAASTDPARRRVGRKAAKELARLT